MKKKMRRELREFKNCERWQKMTKDEQLDFLAKFYIIRQIKSKDRKEIAHILLGENK